MKIDKTNNQLEQAQKIMIKPIVVQLYNQFKNSSEWEQLLLNETFNDHEKETIIIVSIYERLQQYFIEKEIAKIFKCNDVLAQKTKINELLRTVYFHETELFKATRIVDKDEQALSSMDGFYSMISNEKIAMFEVIEEVVTHSK